MTRGIDQEPNKSASDNSQPGQGVHPERVPTDFGGDTPVHPDWKPNPLDVRTSNKNKLAAIAAIGGVAATAVIGAATYFGLKGAGEEIGNKLTGADINTAAPAVPGQTNPERAAISIDTATPDQFYSDANFTDEQRVDWAWNKINQPSHEAGYEGMTLLEVAHKQLAAKMNDPKYGGHQYLKDLVNPSEDMTGDQILALMSTVSFLAATADVPNSDREKILAATSDNSSPYLPDARVAARNRDTDHMGGTSEVPVDSDTNKKIESPVFRHFIPENGYNPNGVPSKIASTMTTSGGAPQYAELVFHFVNGKPLLFDSYTEANGKKPVTDPASIPHESQ